MESVLQLVWRFPPSWKVSANRFEGFHYCGKQYFSRVDIFYVQLVRLFLYFRKIGEINKGKLRFAPVLYYIRWFFTDLIGDIFEIK